MMTQNELNEHIVSAFDKDLQALDALLMTLGKKTGAQLQSAFALCRNGGDMEMIAPLIAGDKELDALEAQINEKAVEIIARRAPMAQDLRHIVATFKLAAALERMGDYAKNIAKRMRIIWETEQGASNQAIADMGLVVCDMLQDVMRAYENIDEKLAIEIRNRDEEVDRLHTNIFRELLKQMVESQGDYESGTLLHFLFIAKNTERMGDYVTDIAEQVYFLKCGTLPDDERPKADKSNAPIKS